jgi:hypothetical protein
MRKRKSHQRRDRVATRLPGSARLNDLLQEMVKVSMTDRRPSVPARNVFNRLRMHHARRVKANQVGA